MSLKSFQYIQYKWSPHTYTVSMSSAVPLPRPSPLHLTPRVATPPIPLLPAATPPHHNTYPHIPTHTTFIRRTTNPPPPRSPTEKENAAKQRKAAACKLDTEEHAEHGPHAEYGFECHTATDKLDELNMAQNKAEGEYSAAVENVRNCEGADFGEHNPQKHVALAGISEEQVAGGVK